MTRRTMVAFVSLLLCGLLALCGCKSSQSLGLAERTAPGAAARDGSARDGSAREGSAREGAADTQLAANAAARTGIAPAKNEPNRSLATAEPSSGLWTRSLNKVSSWFPFRRSSGEPAMERTLDRELTFQPGIATGPVNPGRFGTTSNPADPEKSQGTRQTSLQTNTVDVPDAPSSTPSLVRHSRRPPPDPAPKPPQAERLAAKALTLNPHVKSSTGAGSSEAVAPGKLSRVIATASRSWQKDMAQAVAAHAPAKPASQESELKFSPPNINKHGTGSDAKPSAVAQGSDQREPGKATEKTVATKAVATQRNANTIPRRGDMLAHTTSQVATVAQTDAADAVATKSAAADSAAGWVAKRTEPAAASAEELAPAPSAPSTSAAPSGPKNVVAETFASRTFAPRQTVTSPVAQAPPPTYSTFPLSSEQGAARDPAAPQYVNNPHTAKLPQTRSPVSRIANTARTTPGATTPDAARAAQTSSTAETRAESNAIVRSTPQAHTPASPQVESAPRSTVWQQPLPVAASRNSYQAYYHSGVLPQAAVPPRPTQPPAVAERSPESNPLKPPGEQLAPLIDADMYRQQTAQWQWGGATIPVSASRPAAQGTWLATYQRMVQGAATEGPHTPAPQNAATRSLNSDP